MGITPRMEVLAKLGSASGQIAQPGNGATITLWDSGGTISGAVSQVANKNGGARFKRLLINIFSSHVSAANGLQIDETNDDGTTWDNLVSYTIAATTYTKNVVSVSAPRVRVRYVNSANVLTQWRGAVLGDEYDRASQ